MGDFVLACSSTVDQPKEFFDDRDIPYICFRWISDDGEVHLDDLGQSLSFEEFYARMRKGALPKTSQPNFQDFFDFFESFLREGRDVLYLTLSSGISGAMGSAVSAAEALKENYPERSIYVVDSRNASLGYALLVDAVWRQKDAGRSFKDCCDYALRAREQVETWFYSTDLSWYVHGGRVKPVAGLVGNILNICPVLHVDREGLLIPQMKVRGKQKAAQALIQKMEELAADGRDYHGPVYIVHSDCPEEGEKLSRMVRERFPAMEGMPVVSNIGCVIGAHTGPGTAALTFWGESHIE